MHVPAGHWFPDAIVCIGLEPPSLLAAIFRAQARKAQGPIVRDEHRWCKDPIVSVLFIRDRAPMVQRTLLNLLRLLLLGTKHRWCRGPY